MSPPSTLLLNTLPASPLKLEKKLGFHFNKTSSIRYRCKSSSSSPSTTITEHDLYELLGIDSTADQSQIKRAYRSLQKQCHPDVAGPAGHEMAIILNEVYSVLSDPNSRSAYDQEQAKLAEFRGYTGRPIYSTWFGSESEQRAVFVDEVKCVGCLKCALFASKTFAIESAYGRARVVAQWADAEDKILEAIQTCPVDCISFVQKSDLAALEFLMSKQPRGNVRMTAGNTVGARVSNVFVDVNKFQTRFVEMKEKSSKKNSKFSDTQRESRTSAVQGIRSISNWWYWRFPTSTSPPTETCLSLTLAGRKTSGTSTDPLREAAAKRKLGGTAKPSYRSYEHSQEYWTPRLILPPPPSSSTPTKSPKHQPGAKLKEKRQAATVATHEIKFNPMNLIVPTVMAAVSAARVASERGEMINKEGLREHIGGTIALEVVNSSELQVLLAGLTWFIIGMTVVGLIEAVKNQGAFKK